MTDESKQPTSPGEELNAERQLPREQDAFLTRLVEYAINGVELPVTLWVGGRMVSGILTSGEHFFQNTLDSFGFEVPPPEDSNAAVMIEDLQAWIQLYKEPLNDPPEWLHLRDAQTFKGDGNTIPSDGGVFWRGRISAVDGFHLGMLRASPA